MKRHVSDEEFDRAMGLFRDSARRWSEHWMEQQAPHPPVCRRMGALAFALASVVFAALLLTPGLPQPAAALPFVAIPYEAPPAPYERLEIRRTEIPVAALISAGLDVAAMDPAATVQAEVLMGQDGRIHAVRLVRRMTE